MRARKFSIANFIQLVGLVALGLTGFSGSSLAKNVATYKIQLSRNLKTLNIQVTPSPDQVLTRLRPLSRNAWNRLDKNSLHGLTIRRSGLTVLPTAEHYRYSVDIRGGFKGWIQGNILTEIAVRVTDSRDWFWVPDKWRTNDTIRVEFEIPDGLSVSVPWERIPDMADEPGAPGYFLARPVMLFKKSTVLFGQLQLEQVILPGGTLNLAVAAKTKENKDRYVAWMRRIARIVVDEFGQMPVPSTQVVVIPTWFGNESVPWGEVRRGNGSGLLVMPNNGATMAELVEDWTLYHEFTHLYHPFLGGKGRWVAEGFASYYQNVLRAKAGVISAEYAWERTIAGFARGEQQTRRGKTVASGGLMRTYWTGAVMALELDMRLRRQNETTLGRVLGQFAACCLPASRTWRPLRFMQKLDEISDTKMFTDIYRVYSSGTDFPDYNNLLRSLNIDNSAGSLTFDVSPLRDSIMMPEPEKKSF